MNYPLMQSSLLQIFRLIFPVTDLADSCEGDSIENAVLLSAGGSITSALNKGDCYYKISGGSTHDLDIQMTNTSDTFSLVVLENGETDEYNDLFDTIYSFNSYNVSGLSTKEGSERYIHLNKKSCSIVNCEFTISLSSTALTASSASGSVDFSTDQSLLFESVSEGTTWNIVLENVSENYETVYYYYMPITGTADVYPYSDLTDDKSLSESRMSPSEKSSISVTCSAGPCTMSFFARNSGSNQ